MGAAGDTIKKAQHEDKHSSAEISRSNYFFHYGDGKRCHFPEMLLKRVAVFLGFCVVFGGLLPRGLECERSPRP
jgi:hypothetical protein